MEMLFKTVYMNRPDGATHYSMGDRKYFKLQKNKDYVFKNGDTHDYRYENILVVNKYNGVSQFTKNGRIMYRTRIHINGDYILGEFSSEAEAAIAYNKAVDMLSGLVNITYTPNYIEGISSVEYASLYHNIILSKNFRNYVKSVCF